MFENVLRGKNECWYHELCKVISPELPWKAHIKRGILFIEGLSSRLLADAGPFTT